MTEPTHTEWNIEREQRDGSWRLGLPSRNEERMHERLHNTNWGGRTARLVRREVTEWETVETRENSGHEVIESPDNYDLVWMQVPIKK
jgi:hypothetical protein